MSRPEIQDASDSTALSLSETEEMIKTLDQDQQTFNQSGQPSGSILMHSSTSSASGTKDKVAELKIDKRSQPVTSQSGQPTNSTWGEGKRWGRGPNRFYFLGTTSDKSFKDEVPGSGMLVKATRLLNQILKTQLDMINLISKHNESLRDDIRKTKYLLQSVDKKK